MESKIPSFLLESPAGMNRSDNSSLGMSFMDKGLGYIARLIKDGYDRWELASQKGFLQKFDPRVKVFFLIFFIVLISSKKTIFAEGAIGALIIVLVALSRLNVINFYKRVFFFGFVFGFLIALPSSLSIITRGDIVMHIFELPKPIDFWSYHIPRQIGITRQGLAGVIMLTLRVSNSVALSLLIISTTPFHEVVRALKMLRVPDEFLMIFTLTYKYIFIYAATVHKLYLARKSRLAVPAGGAEGRAWAAGRMAFIFR